MTRTLTALDLTAARHLRGLSQARLAELSGLCRLTVGEIERGHAPRRLSTAVALAQALGVPFQIVVHPDGETVEVHVLEPQNERSAGDHPALRGKDGDAAPTDTA